MKLLDLLTEAQQLLTENPNQAIKFLKDQNMDPATIPGGKRIFDTITGITRGDGFTFLLTKLLYNMIYRGSSNVSDSLIQHRTEVITKLYQYLRANKDLLSRLPKPVHNYETYREIRNDIDRIEDQRSLKKLLNTIGTNLSQQVDTLTSRKLRILIDLSKKFFMLKPEKQRHFMSKVFGYKDINIFGSNLQRYINEVESEQDYDATKAKVESTPDAHLVYDNPQLDILIAHINSYDAMKTLGCTANWCIVRDIARYRSYKAGKNYYFFIWDYNYPVDNPNFFIATAFNSQNPSKSSTHEHINDHSLNLGNVLSEKNLNFEILENYIMDFLKRRSEEYRTNSSLALALKDGNADALLELIEYSATISKYRNSDPELSYNGDKIDMGIKEENMIEMLELGDEFKYIQSASYSSYESNYDSDDADYMKSGLDDTNMDSLIELAKKLGVPKKEYKTFGEKEGAIAEFLEKYGMRNLVDSYLSEYSDAQGEAEQNAAKELLEDMPFDVSDGSFDIEKMWQYYMAHELTATNFDELIEQVKQQLPDFSYDSISSARYEDIDLDHLNADFKEGIEKIMLDMEIDEDNPYYLRAKTIGDATEYLQKLGFKILGSSQNDFAKLTLPKSIIRVTDIESEEQDDGSYKIMVNASIHNTGYEKSKKFISGAKKIRVPITSLKNYIAQPQLPLKEHLTLMGIIEDSNMKKIIIKESQFRQLKNLLIKEAIINTLGDDWDDLSSEDRAERLFGKKTPLQKQFSKIMVDKLSSDDDIESYKWATYNAILIELEKLGEHKIIEEIEYYITDPKQYYDPWNIFDDATKKVSQTPEIQRLRKVLQDFRGVESGHEPTIDDFLNPTEER
jgi:hypothetical protein